MRATKAYIHLENLRHNMDLVRAFTGGGAKICVPVKADAYGHGALRIALEALKCGADFLAVATVQEGIELRGGGIGSPLLLLSLAAPEEIPSIIEHSITPLVFDRSFIERLAQAAAAAQRRVSVHLKIDTGMGRIGCAPEQAPAVAEFIAKQPWLYLEGACTHFAASDSLAPQDVEFTRLQFARFSQALEQIRARGIAVDIAHCANSGAVLLHPETHLDMVRPGIIVYGYFPDECGKASAIRSHLEAQSGNAVAFKPLMELASEVVAIKRVKKGDTISYGRTWTAKGETDIATIPAGYADGLLRRFSSGLSVCINGGTYPIVGRICMDQCMVDLGANHAVKLWDSVTVFGARAEGGAGGAVNTAADLAAIAGTIPYEITCGINKRVPRVYTGESLA